MNTTKAYEPVRVNGLVKATTRSFPVTMVHVLPLRADGKPAGPGEHVRRNNWLVYAPGINPQAVTSVRFDSIHYAWSSNREAQVTFKNFTEDEQWDPRTKDFTLLAQFEAHYAKGDE